MKKIIGITSDFLEQSEYSNYPHYILRKNYFDSVIKFGAIPVLLLCDNSLIDYYISQIDGLIITGGNFDIDPNYYGEKITNSHVATNHKRTDFEKELFEKSIKKNIPILGICAGEQLINVMQGGSLIQHIPDEIKNCLEHEQKTPKHETSHTVYIEENTLLHKIVKAKEIQTNSTHHQAVKKTGKNIIVSAHASDGVIEAIELQNYKFCLAVQWHPEYLSTEADNLIFEHFIKQV